MIASAVLRLRHEAIFGPIREAARATAQDFVVSGMKEYVARWGDHVYGEGTQIDGDGAAEAYARAKQADVEAFRRLGKVQQAYGNSSPIS
jgi:hypothetical protein